MICTKKFPVQIYQMVIIDLEKRYVRLSRSLSRNFLVVFISLLHFSIACSGSRSAIVTNTTVKIMVPENIIGCVYGEDGSNLTRLRQVCCPFPFINQFCGRYMGFLNSYFFVLPFIFVLVIDLSEELNQISGARVMVHEPRPGTTDRIIVISGTPDETQAAQSLLQAFILTE